MSVVIDVSAVMPWGVPDEDTDSTAPVRARVQREQAVVPSLFWFELANAVVRAERRGRITEEKGTEFLEFFDDVIADEAVPPASALAQLARVHGLTAYDAAYLWVAQSRGLPLATLDGQLRAAATKAGIEVL